MGTLPEPPSAMDDTVHVGFYLVEMCEVPRGSTVCLGKTKSLGVLKGLSTDHFGIIKRAIHVMCDLSKSAFEWEPKENLENEVTFTNVIIIQ